MATAEALHGTVFSGIYSLFGITGDIELIQRMGLIAIVYTVVVGIVSIVQPVAYGKHSDTNSIVAMFTMNAKVAWVIQEAPAFVVPLLLIIQTPCSNLIENSGNKLALFCFVAHYVQRSLVYPQRFTNAKPAPIINFVMASLFCAYNGLFQGLHLTNVYTTEASASTIFGVLIFLSGMAINIHSDGILTGLRKTSGGKTNGKSDYKIPRGGFFEVVSSANYFGEIVEWWGLFIATNGTPQLIFAIFSTVFLGIRAVHNHQWYKKTFGNKYPVKRKALIPFVY